MTEALRTTLEEGVAMVGESVKFLREQGLRVFFDAEHCFDGYKHNPEYTLRVLEAAATNGAEVELAPGASEELDVLGVRSRPATLDEADAEAVELLGDAQLVLDGGADALDLQAVAQRGVEHLDEAPLVRCRHDRLRKSKEPPGWAARACMRRGHMH